MAYPFLGNPQKPREMTTLHREMLMLQCAAFERGNDPILTIRFRHIRTIASPAHRRIIHSLRPASIKRRPWPSYVIGPGITHLSG